MNCTTLSKELIKVFGQYSDRFALYSMGKFFSYSDVESLANIILRIIFEHGTPLSPVGLLGSRSFEAVSGISGILMAGCHYVPLNPFHPVDRIAGIIKSTGIRNLVLAPEGFEKFDSLALHLNDLTIVCLGNFDVSSLRAKFPKLRFIEASLFGAKGVENTKYHYESAPDDPAYIIFTSGSTGNPKGVLITHKNACAYVNHTINLHALNEFDRFTGNHDFSFDFSVHDIFISILSGGCIYFPEDLGVAMPDFVVNHGITVWSSVPSVATLLKQLELLKPGAMPSLRLSFFCGEALKISTADSWLISAPNSRLFNIYGPTEATVAITEYEYEPKDDKLLPGPFVPIGFSFAGNEIVVIDCDSGDIVLDGIGELHLSGIQVAKGYHNNPEQTQSRFVKLPKISSNLWYRTGDLVRISSQNNAPLEFVGRADDQVKINGYRIEIGEVESVLGRAANSDRIACVAIKVDEDGEQISQLVAFIEGAETKGFDRSKFYEEMQERLPQYMIPADLFFVKNLPINSNGKIDKKQLVEMAKSFDVSEHNLLVDGHSIDPKPKCYKCLKSLAEDERMRGPGLLLVLNHNQDLCYICQICFAGH